MRFKPRKLQHLSIKLDRFAWRKRMLFVDERARFLAFARLEKSGEKSGSFPLHFPPF